MPRRTAVAATLGVAGAAAVAYGGLIERNAFTLRRAEVPILAPGSLSLRVLHISDVHMRPDQRRKQAWIRDLADLQPDFIINTGDNLGSAHAVPAILATYDAFAGIPGVFVLGSNDYYAPKPKNPFKYFFPRHKRVVGDPNPWRQLVDGMLDRGWIDLTNRRTTLTVRGRTIAFAGVDDPHLKQDDRAVPAQPADSEADVRIALVHAPEPRVLDAYSAAGYQLIAAGHTHGGQLRVPFFGALVTNCGIDRARARGLNRYADTWLHVSAGLGTSPFAPVRFSCRPEASLLTLVPASE
jgi:predicted MPP superfamily phosphohydrolase